MDSKTKNQIQKDRLQVLAQTYNTSAEIIEIIVDLKLIDIKSIEGLTTKIKEYINSNDESFIQDVLIVLWSKYPDAASFIWNGQIIKNSFENKEERKEVLKMEEKKPKFKLNEKVIMIIDGYPVRGLITEVRDCMVESLPNVSYELFNLSSYDSDYWYRVIYFEPQEYERQIVTIKEDLIYKDLNEATAAFKESFEDLAKERCK